jgi:hypothetical protein
MDLLQANIDDFNNLAEPDLAVFDHIPFEVDENRSGNLDDVQSYVDEEILHASGAGGGGGVLTVTSEELAKVQFQESAAASSSNQFELWPCWTTPCPTGLGSTNVLRTSHTILYRHHLLPQTPSLITAGLLQPHHQLSTTQTKILILRAPSGSSLGKKSKAVRELQFERFSPRDKAALRPLSN